MGEWTRQPLGELLTVHHGYAFPSKEMHESLTGKPIIVSIGNFLYTGGFRFGSTRTREFRGDYPKEFELSPGDLLVVMTCQTEGGEILGVPGIVPDDGRTYLHNQRIGRVFCNDSRLDKKFAYYLFLSPEVNRQLVSSASGTKILHTAPNRISDVVCSVPDISEQEKIAELLGALDGKIAANERIADTSNELVKLILDGLLRESDSTTGWTEATLDSVADVNARKVSPTPGGKLRYIDIASVSPGKIIWPDLTDWDSAPSRARRGVSRGDVLWSTVRPNRRSHALLLDDDPTLVASTGFAVLTPRSIGHAYLYAVTSRDEFVDYWVGAAEGSAYPAVRADRFKKAIIPLPPKGILERFEDEAAAILGRAHSADVESRALSSLRDTLLPKLVSGEIRIKDAEREVSDAV